MSTKRTHLMPTSVMRITFVVTPQHLARAMALDARDNPALAGYPWGPYEDEAPEFVAHVRNMTKARALKASPQLLRGLRRPLVASGLPLRRVPSRTCPHKDVARSMSYASTS